MTNLVQHTNNPTIRIKGIKTLKRYIRTGKLNQLIQSGLIFNPGCGRLLPYECTCNHCMEARGLTLTEDIEVYEAQKQFHESVLAD